MSKINRRDLLRAGALLGGSGIVGSVAADVLSGQNGSLLDTSAETESEVPRFEGWRSTCNTYWKRTEPWDKKHIFTTASSLQYLGSSFEKDISPDPESDADGAWRHTFVLSSLGVRLNGPPSGSASALNFSGVLSNNFAVASGNQKLNALLEGDAETNDGRDEIYKDTLEDVSTSEYSTEGENLALAPYHDDDLYRFADPGELKGELNRRRIKQGLGRLSDVSSDNVTERRVRQRETLGSDAAIGLGLAIGGLVTGGILATVYGVLGLGWSVYQLGEELFDNARLPGEVPYNAGFGSRRAGDAAPVEAHSVVFDALVSPGSKEAFCVKPKHKPLGDESAFVFISSIKKDKIIEWESRGPEETPHPAVEPIWLVGVSGPAEDASAEEPAATILGTNFEKWTNYRTSEAYPETDRDYEIRQWEQSPKPGISGPGMWAGENLAEVFRDRFEDGDDEDLIAELREALDPIPPPAKAETHTYDASGTVLAGSHVDTYEWKFQEITGESDSGGKSYEHWRAAFETPVEVDDVLLAQLYKQTGTTEPVETLAGVSDLIKRVNDDHFPPSVAPRFVQQGLTEASFDDEFAFDIREESSDQTREIDFSGREGLWGANLVVHDENGKRGLATALVNVGERPPRIGRIANPTSPIEPGLTERFVLEDVSSPKDDELTYAWTVMAAEEIRRETGGRSIVNLFDVISRGEELEVEFKRAGEYIIRAVVTDPDGAVGVKQRQVFLLEGEDSGYEPGEVKWSFETGDDVLSSPTVVDGTVFIGSDNNDIYALDAADGTVQWQYETEGPVRSSPTVVDDIVFVGSSYPDNNIYALDVGDGSEQWTYGTGNSVDSSPTVVGDTVFVGSRDNNVYALDVGEGTERWTYETSGEIRSSPTVVDDTVFIGSDDGSMYALDAADGTVRWSYETGGSVRSSPTVIDDTVFVGSYDGNTYALDVSDGTTRWRWSDGSSRLEFMRSSTVVDGTVFGGIYGSGSTDIYALDAADGTAQWTYETGGSILSSPTVADGTVFVGNAQYEVPSGATPYIYALDAADGTVQWKYETDDFVESSPTVVDGTVFVGSGDNNVYALEAGVEGSSEGSRVLLGTLGHTEAWARRASTGGSGTTPPPVTGDTRPTDPDGDGTYEDVTGDGDVDSIDVSALNDNLDSDAVQNNPGAFDFDGDGDVDADDVEALFDELDGGE